MAGTLTPMMRQYLDIKEKHPDCILMYRLGDFYEMFFDDANTASRELDLVLTGRDCGLDERAPMCGVPYHSVDSYIAKLIEKGYKVAICEQLSDPKNSPGLVERDVTRVITAGTIIEESMLDEGKNNHIAALFCTDARCGVAYCDVSTGSFSLLEIAYDDDCVQLFDELARICPREVICCEALFMNAMLASRLSREYNLQRYSEAAFEPKRAAERLRRHFNAASLDGLACGDAPFGITAAGALLMYLEETQKNALAHIKGITAVNRSEYMALDSSTRRNLELTEPLRYDGSRKSTLLYVLDRTQTSMGKRLLRSWISQPLRVEAAVNERLDAVDTLFSDRDMLSDLRNALSSVYDIERLCSKIAYGAVNGRDCISLVRTLETLPAVKKALEHANDGALVEIRESLDVMDDVRGLVASAIAPEPPVGIADGGVIREGYNKDVDRLRSIAHNGKAWIKKLENDEKERTGIRNLKIGFNRVFGYYIEVSRSALAQVPYNYERKQTLANSERFITPELKELESSILGANEQCVELEYKLFLEIRQALYSSIERLQLDSRLIAKLDVLQSFADTARRNGFVKPKFSSDGVIDIKQGRHPVVEASLKDSFIPNDVLLDRRDNRLHIITGPNMAGKSTFMRQVAIIALMAHMGSFVPAAACKMCILDRIFTRVGASDNLAFGQSTFMVEMSEVAMITRNATSNSLIILDEIGRGTSTYDGLSIAWAVLEFIADRERCGAMTLFATHYHELTELEGALDGVKNYRVTAKEIGEDIIFLHRIVRGGTDKSFGVQVARLAGLPDGIIARAKAILVDLEDESRMRRASAASTAPAPQPLPKGEVERYLAQLSIETITPLEAITILDGLHKRVRGEE